MNEWIIVLLAGLGSYLLRMSMIASDRVRVPERLEASVGLVAPAAFAALTSSSLAAAAVAVPTIAAIAPLAVATAVAVALVARTRWPYASLLGLPAYWLIAAVLGTAS